MPEQHPIEKLFQQFLEESKNDKDIEYCLIQSSVEPTIRFKFGSWASRQPNITLNLMETGRLDLMLGVGDQLYIIEFGHLLNLLKHNREKNNKKIMDDSDKIDNKTKKILLYKNSFFKSRFLKEFNQVHHLTCSLFSDFRLAPEGYKFKTILSIDPFKSGTLFKYGYEFRASMLKYYTNYLNYLNISDENDTYLYGYKPFAVIEDQLYLHYKFDPKESFSLNRIL
jgi:hypothetical protein